MTATAEVLAAVITDPLPSRQTDRQHIEAAIAACAAAHNGLVTIAHVRPYITRDVWPPMVGAVMHAWARAHGERRGWALNGGPSRNASKPARVWKAIA